MKKNLKDLYCQRPHVVIVGAGASRAVMGKSCPTMNEAIEQVGLDRILEGFMLETKARILKIYIVSCLDVVMSVKRTDSNGKNFMNIFKCAASIFLDHLRPLILSLTEKDCIVSFNWDSLLIQAYNRVAKITWNRPEILFLHGNVGLVCAKTV